MSQQNISNPRSKDVEARPSSKIFKIQTASNKQAGQQKPTDGGHPRMGNSSHQDGADSNILALDSPKIKREFEPAEEGHQNNQASPPTLGSDQKKSKATKGLPNSTGTESAPTTKANAQRSAPTDLYKSIASKISAQIQNINKFHKGKDGPVHSDQQSLESESTANVKFQTSRHSKKIIKNDEKLKRMSNHDDYLNKLENELIQNEESLLQTQEHIEEKQLPLEQPATSKIGQVDQAKEKKLENYYKDNNFSQPNYSETLFNSQSSLLKRGENVENNSKTILSQSTNRKDTKISSKSNKANINLKKVIKTSLSQQSDKNSFGERRTNSAKKSKKQKKNAEKNQSLSQTSLPTQPLNTNLMNDKDSYRQERAIKPYSQKSKQILCKEQNSQEMDYKLDRRSSAQYSQTENVYRNDRIGLFSEEIAVFGHVPLIFYMPNISKHNSEFINSNGGEVTHLVECFTIQLFKPTGDKHQDRGDSTTHKAINVDTSQIPIEEYYPGNIVSWQWLIDMINKCERLPVDPYVIMKIEYPQNSAGDRADKYAKMQFNQMKKLSGQRTRFTIRELIKIFQVTQEFPSKKNKNQVYWQRFIKQGVFPGRSVNSVNAQWQRFCHYDTIEQAIHKAYQLGMPYSTSFPQLPPIIKEEFEQRLLSIKGEMGLGNFIPQSNLNTSQIKPNKPKMIKTQQYQYSQRDYVQFKTDYSSIKTKTEDIFNNRMSTNLHRSMNIGQKRVHHHIIPNSNAQENQNGALPRPVSQSINQRMIKQESCVVNQNQAYSNPLQGEKYQKNDQKTNYQNDQSQYKCSKDPCSFVPSYGAKSNQKQFNQSQSKDAGVENDELEENDIEEDQSSSNSEIVRASSSGDLIKVKCEDNEFDFNNNQQFSSPSSFDKLAKAKSKKQLKKLERQKSLIKQQKVQSSFKQQYQANNDGGEKNASGNNNQYEQQSYGQIDEAHLNTNKKQIEAANFEKPAQATPERQAYNPTKDVENSQNAQFSTKFQNPPQAQYKCGYMGKSNAASTDISADYQQVQSPSAVQQQNIHLQMPHGNSLAMAKECIYCIAKRICLQSTMEFTSRQPLCNRFAKLNGAENLEQDQNEETIKHMLKKSDNTWAQLIAVTIKQSSQSDSYQMQGKKRCVQINQEIGQIDDLEYSQRRSADDSKLDQNSKKGESRLNQIERIEFNSNNPLTNQDSQEQMPSDHHNSPTHCPISDANIKNNVKKFQINRKLLMSQPNSKMNDHDMQSQNKERGPSQYLKSTNNDLKSDVQIEDDNSILGTEKSHGANQKVLQANELLIQSKQHNEICIQESDIQEQSQVRQNSAHLIPNGDDQLENGDCCVKQMGEQLANSPMYNNAFIEQSQQNSGIMEGDKSQYQQSNDGFAYESPNQHYDNQQHQMFQQIKHQQQIRQYPNDLPEFLPSNNATSISNGGYHPNPVNGQFQNQINQGQTYFINNSQNFWNMREFSPGQAYPNQQYPYQSEIQSPQPMVGHYPQQPQHYPSNVNILQNYPAGSGYYLIPQPNLSSTANFNDRQQQAIQQSYDMDGNFSYSERTSNYNTQNPANNRALMQQLPAQPPIQSQQCLPTYYSNASNEFKN